jgi:D-glycero-beta-D-manno-heptose-7-phosphate kinase
MSHGLRAESLALLIPKLEGRRVSVIGDPVLDCYLYGTTHRISREAPVLIVREDSREFRLGGAANTAANIAALGAKTSLVGLVGADDDGARLAEIAAAKSIDTARIKKLERGCTVTKTRVLAGALNTTKQQMLRIDRENDDEVNSTDAARLADAAEAAIEHADAVVISDYGSGALTPTYVALAKHAKARGKIVVVDSRRSMKSFAGATAITPNEAEAEAALGGHIKNAEEAAAAAARLQAELSLDAMILTRGRAGMAIAERGKSPVLIAAHGGHEAVDVTGAGDTVVAAFTVALAAGASILEAAVLANCAASVVVKYVGAATCSPAELAAALGDL